MGHLHDPNNPRHARLFELLRQRELAQGTHTRLKHGPVPAHNAAAVARVQAQALQSFRGMNMDAQPRRARRQASHLGG